MNWIPWAIGGIVGLGAIAFVSRGSSAADEEAAIPATQTFFQPLASGAGMSANMANLGSSEDTLTQGLAESLTAPVPRGEGIVDILAEGTLREISLAGIGLQGAVAHEATITGGNVALMQALDSTLGRNEDLSISYDAAGRVTGINARNVVGLTNEAKIPTLTERAGDVTLKRRQEAQKQLARQEGIVAKLTSRLQSLKDDSVPDTKQAKQIRVITENLEKAKAIVKRLTTIWGLPA